MKNPIVRRIGDGGNTASVAKNSCPDFFELENGDFAIIGTDMTEQYKDRLPGDAAIADYERLVVVPRNLILSAKRDIPEKEMLI